MMKKIDFKSVFVPTISLFIICLIITAALSVTNAVTKGKISENEAQARQDSMKIVCPSAVSFEEVKDGCVFIALDSSGNTVGYAISTVANGYGGQVKVMTGINDGKVLGIDVYYNDDETPGLGKNTSNDSFTSQFKEKDSGKSFIVNKDFSGDGEQIDAVTSATISSRAVISAVNEACEIYNEIISGGVE